MKLELQAERAVNFGEPRQDICNKTSCALPATFPYLMLEKLIAERICFVFYFLT